MDIAQITNLYERIVELEKRVDLLEKKKVTRPRSRVISFDWKPIINNYPKRNDQIQWASTCACLKRSVLNQEDYNNMITAVNNYKRHCTLKGMIGTEFVMSIRRFVTTDWKDWISKEQKKISTMNEKDILNEL